jgi:splicing factor 3A subunit 1
LVDHYTKILLPPRDLLEKMRKEVQNPFFVQKNIQYRVEWERAQQREKQREDELAEKERIAYAQIDWHDFVVVETVDYQPGETGNFPAPTTPQDVGARIIAQERIDQGLFQAGDNGQLLAETIIVDESRVDLAPPTENVEEAGTDVAKQNQV